MIVIEQQLHGYRHGHELLSTSLRLSSQDQDLLDRLSDIAGPLGPGERFLPYLTCYPLPSGSYYVLARTWQDLNAPRAGCVRTRSLLIPMQSWMTLYEPAVLADAVSAAGPTGPTETISVLQTMGKQLPPVEGVGTELLEAIFLEERMPVAVFGAEIPEIIALRLLTAIWPSYRRNFTLSTFCNSPRTIAKKSFDLVFSPIEARSRFSDWKGRRIDGRRNSTARHKWSSAIVDRIFRSQHPSLSGLDVLGEMAGDELGSEDALRVSLLWDELYQKISTEPIAALGLLDIANTRSTSNPHLVDSLGPALALAAAKAVDEMPPRDAWGFLQTLTNKVGNSKLRLSVAKSIRSSTISLALQYPKDAVGVIPKILAKDSQGLLLGAIGDGLVGTLTHDVARMLAELRPIELVKLMIASPTLAGKIIRKNIDLDTQIRKGLEEASPEILVKAQRRFIKHITSDLHAEVFRILASGMNGPEIIAQIKRLYDANGLSSTSLNNIIVHEARCAGAVSLVRDYVATLHSSPVIDQMLKDLIEPTEESIRWLLDQSSFNNDRRSLLLCNIFDTAPSHALASIFSEVELLSRVLTEISGYHDHETRFLTKIFENVSFITEEWLAFFLKIIPRLDKEQAAPLAARWLYEILDREIGESRNIAIKCLIEISGKYLNSKEAIRIGLSKKASSTIASQNLIIFENTPYSIRIQFVKSAEIISKGIIERRALDLSYEGANAAGSLLWDASAGNHPGFSDTAAKLLPLVMRERCQPASALIAAIFPSVYRNLQRDSAPDIFTLMFPFLMWDRCKIARRELATSFSKSNWLATDIALAAARAGDTVRILRVIARTPGGRLALAEIQRDIEKIQTPWRQSIRSALTEIHKTINQ